MGLFSLPQVESDLTVYFVLDAVEYEVCRFSIGFSQSVDYKGQPQDEVRGGRMLLELSQTLPDNVYLWAMTSCPKSGEVIFRSKSTEAPFRVIFKNAYCVNFERIIMNGGGIKTTLLISPDELSVNGISFDNHWV